MSLPNIITLARMFMVPVVVYLIITGQPAAAFWLFIIAGATDAVDGFIAKQFDLATELGAYLDPLADKLLLISIYITLGVTEALPIWLVFLVVSRDILIVLAFVVSWLVGSPIKVRPLYVSKANTAAQIVLAGVVLADFGLDLSITGLQQILIVAVAALTLLSLYAYFAEWMRHLASTPDAHPGSDGEGGA
ncbi:MAG: CDP-alcohol phosphatidyltransferase family protein [Halocynthiibacter sp.]